MSRPNPTEYAAPYSKYTALVPEEDILAAMSSELHRTCSFLSAVSEQSASICHPPYTWTAKQVVGHITDTERVFGYRALCFARCDATALPGFDENEYVRNADFDQLPLADLVAEFEALRRSHICFFKNLPAARWSQTGNANGNDVSVRALAYMLVGHERHHMAILRQRLDVAV